MDERLCSGKKKKKEKMSRSLHKGPYIDERLAKKIAGMKAGDRQVMKTWSRSASITPEMVGFGFGVHNGKQFVSVQVTEDMVGHKLGEFSPTTKFSRHGGKMQKDLEQKQAAGAAPSSSPAASPGGTAQRAQSTKGGSKSIKGGK